MKLPAGRAMVGAEVLVLPLLAPLSARAEPPPPQQMVETGNTLALVGAILTPAGIAMYSSNDETTRVVGFVGALVGPPLLCGGTAYAARGIRHLGVSFAPVGSVVCWVGWVGANLWAFAAPGSPGPYLAYGAFYVGGVGQLIANGVAWHRATLPRDEARRLELRVVPRGTVRAPGIAVEGRW